MMGEIILYIVIGVVALVYFYFNSRFVYLNSQRSEPLLARSKRLDNMLIFFFGVIILAGYSLYIYLSILSERDAVDE